MTSEPYPRRWNLAYPALTSSFLRALSRGVAKAGRCAAPAGRLASRHSGGIGAPPGTTRSPRQELADDLGVAPPASRLREARFGERSKAGLLERDALTGKRGPMPNRRCIWRAERRPRAVRHEP